MHYAIRPATEADYPQLLAILNADRPQPIPLEAFKSADEQRPAHFRFQRFVAESPEGALLGYASAGEHEEAAPNHFVAGVRVAPAYRRQGLGRALLQAIADWARSQGALRLESTIDDKDEAALAAVERLGLTTEGHVLRSEVDLTDWAPSAEAWATVTRAEANGIRFVTLAELGTTEANLRQFHQYCASMEEDVPGRSPHLLPFEQWRAKKETDPTWDPSAILIALDGEAWAGISHMEPQPDESWYTYLTAVSRSHRGRGLGTAIKVASIKLAKERSVPSLYTYNHAVNKPMLAINAQMGYQVVAGIYQVYYPQRERAPPGGGARSLCG